MLGAAVHASCRYSKSITVDPLSRIAKVRVNPLRSSTCDRACRLANLEQRMTGRQHNLPSRSIVTHKWFKQLLSSLQAVILQSVQVERHPRRNYLCTSDSLTSNRQD